jgi:hypothetical protein
MYREGELEPEPAVLSPKAVTPDNEQAGAPQD